jgi:hypothetical protein
LPFNFLLKKMPLEIKELVIKVNVTEPGAGQSNAAQRGGGRRSQAGGGVDKKAIVKECVEQVMEILKNKTER